MINVKKKNNKKIILLNTYIKLKNNKRILRFENALINIRIKDKLIFLPA